MPRLVNRYEEIAHGTIKASADRWGLSVYPKVRVADVIDLDELGVVGELKRFGLQSHFDFVVCRDQWEMEYAVEFDGRYHTTPVQAVRDRKKNELCERATFPMLRINSNYLTAEFGSMSLLAWLMDVYELQIAFEKAQESGAVPMDEPFDPFLLTSNDWDHKERRPYFLSARARSTLQQLHREGVIRDPMSSGFIGYGANEVLRGIEYIRLTDKVGLHVQTAMQPQLFPVRMSDLLDEVLSVQLGAKVAAWQNGKIRPVALSDIYDIVNQMDTKLRLAQCHGYRREAGS